MLRFTQIFIFTFMNTHRQGEKNEKKIGANNEMNIMKRQKHNYE